MADPVRGPLGRLSETAALTLLRVAYWESWSIGVVILGSPYPTTLVNPSAADVDAALAELRAKVLR